MLLFTQIDQELWPLRPLSVSLAETLLCCVKYLHELRQLLIEKMMVEYMAGVDIYLSSVRNIPDSEVSWYAVSIFLDYKKIHLYTSL